MRRVSLQFALLGVLVCAAGGARASRCDGRKTHPYAEAGLTGQLTTLQHMVGGTFTIISDCEFMIDDWTFDGAAPAVYWWGFSDIAAADLNAGSDGFRISDELVEGFSDGGTLVIELKEDVTWDMVDAVSAWCELVDADMGNIDVAMLAAEAGVNGDANGGEDDSEDDSGSQPPIRIQDMANCMTLLDGVYNLHWQLSDDGEEVYVGLEGRVGTAMWMGVGFAAADQDEVFMTGADVVVAGTVNGECFATDYFLESRSQCAQATQDMGVCPDAGLAGNSAANHAELLSCDVEGDLVTLLFRRPVDTGDDQFDVVWPREEERPLVWAIGPVSEDSDASNPTVLYHFTALPGQESDSSVRADPGARWRLEASVNHCRQLSSSDEEPAPAPQAGGDVAVLLDETLFNVTIGPNPNYPNPPGWGISYHINGFESPVLELECGVDVTFVITAGETHPFYITTSSVGAGAAELEDDEIIFAGGPDSHGTPEEPYYLDFMATDTMPDEFYYQCYTHKKLGWKIMKVGDCDPDNVQSAGI